MNNFNNYNQHADVAGFNAYLSKVFGWMFAGLGLSFATALFTANSPTLLGIIFGSTLRFYLLVGIELFLVYKISRNVTKYSYGKSSFLFMLYSFINGLTLASIFIVFNLGTISTAFVSASIMFGVMAVYGKVSKKDLSSWGSFLFMGVIGIIIASVINVFLNSDAMDFVICGVGVFVFAGLTAYDMQKLKRYYYTYGDSDIADNIAVSGALSLYLDFVNIFLFLLRIFARD